MSSRRMARREGALSNDTCMVQEELEMWYVCGVMIALGRGKATEDKTSVFLSELICALELNWVLKIDSHSALSADT